MLFTRKSDGQPSRQSRIAKAIAGLFLGVLVVTGEGFAHPGSGIFLDREGNLYFIDTGSGLWKVGKDGKLTRLSAPAYHWMALDRSGRLNNATFPSLARDGATLTRSSSNPRILLSSDFPITVGHDGSLYYPWFGNDERVQVFRLTPEGATSVLATLPARTESGALRWLNGIVASNDGSIYYSENTSVRRITPKGELTTVVASIALSDCDSVPEVGPEQVPYLRGLDVDAQGTVYVAATGCRVVLKITADKKISTILRATSPWSPTAVAVSGSDLYVLEYVHRPGDDRREWAPRVRKVAADGTVTIIAEIKR